MPLHAVTGVAGACGWLALLALYAGGPREDGRLTGLRRLASAVGRRSMTAYLSQTILFGTIFVIVPVLAVGQRLWVGQAGAALIALAVYGPGARWACRSLRDPAAHRRGPQRAQAVDGSAGCRFRCLNQREAFLGLSSGRMAGEEDPPFGGGDPGA